MQLCMFYSFTSGSSSHSPFTFGFSASAQQKRLLNRHFAPKEIEQELVSQKFRFVFVTKYLVRAEGKRPGDLCLYSLDISSMLTETDHEFHRGLIVVFFCDGYQKLTEMEGSRP